jgi:UDP-2,3-diacylglucosamine hydrolase
VATLFISDLHLSLKRPEKLDDFIQLLRGPARNSDAVYILGDLFEEFWVGIDDATPPNKEIISALQEFSRHGPHLYILKGNRELLLDDNFYSKTGAIKLPDRAVINLNGKRVLLMHGDLLCTRDYKYQRFRQFMVNPIIKTIIKILPYSLRIWLSHGLRPAMNRSVLEKPEKIMDVEQSEVEFMMHKHNVTELIHGHTHRPGMHQFEIEGVVNQRIVLGDWYSQAQILVCKEDTRRMVPVLEYLQENAE